jgi:hypothetical protein
MHVGCFGRTGEGTDLLNLDACSKRLRVLADTERSHQKRCFHVATGLGDERPGASSAAAARDFMIATVVAMPAITEMLLRIMKVVLTVGIGAPLGSSS